MGMLVTPELVPVRLLEITVGGRVLRYGEQPVVVGSGASALRFTAGLSVDFTEEVELTASSPPARQVSVQVAGEVSWGSLRRRLSDATAKLYSWGGGSLAAAELVLVGRISEPAVCDPDAPPGVASFTITETSGDDRGLLLETALADDTTMPITAPGGIAGTDIPTAYAGTYYPEVIGHPGTPYPTWFTADGVAPGSPAILPSGHGGALFDDGSVVVVKRGVSRVTSGRLWDQDGHSDGATLSTLHDLRGAAITVADLMSGSFASPLTVADISTGWAFGWSDTPTSGPGGRPLRGLGDVIVWALERAGVDLPGATEGRAWDIDWPSLLDGVAGLNRFRIDTYIAEQVGVWSWLTSDILPFFPVFLGRTGRGIYMAEWRYRARASEATVRLQHGRNAYRISALAELQMSDVYTEITTRLGLDCRSGNPLRTATFTGAAVVGGTEDGMGRHGLLERAWPDVGRRAMVVDVPVVADLATGYEVQEFLCARYAQPLAEVWYRCPWQMAAVRPLDVVRVVDAEADLDGVGTITGRRPAAGCVDLRVLVHP